MAPPPVIVVDTGFVLSVAAITGLPPVLGQRWAGRATWPTEVQSELRFRDRNPGRGVPPGLARRALDGAHLWLPAPVELTLAQIEHAHVIARQLGGTDDLTHIGEAAGVVLAQTSGGILATEDLAAADLIRAQFGVPTTCITAVLQKLANDGTWTAGQVAAALKALQAKSRPNVDGLSATDVIDGSWSRRRRRR